MRLSKNEQPHSFYKSHFLTPENGDISFEDCLNNAIDGLSFREVFKFADENENFHWVECTGKPAFDAENKVYKINGTFQDVTDKFLSKMELQKTIDVLDSFFNISVDLMCICNLEGRFLKINPQFEKTLGHEIHEFVGKTFLHFMDQNTQKDINKKNGRYPKGRRTR